MDDYGNLKNFLRSGEIKDNSLYKISRHHVKECGGHSQKECWRLSHRRNNNFEDAVRFLFNAQKKKILKENLMTWGEHYEHNTDDAFIIVRHISPEEIELETGNVVGNISFDGWSLKVSSRFGDNFLKFLLEYAHGAISVSEVGRYADEKNGYDWLLSYIWELLWTKACCRGVPKEYVPKVERLRFFRGNIDPLDYILNKKTATYKCSFREQTYETKALSLFKEAVRYLRDKAGFKNQKAYIFLQQNAPTKRYSVRELLEVKPFTNPYYQPYTPLIEFSKIILKHYSVDNSGSKAVDALFFDVSMLFEYCIKQILQRKNLHIQNKKNLNLKIATGGSMTRRLEPDLVIEKLDKNFVFDVKYKNFDKKAGVKREDLFQIHTYIGQMLNKEKELKGAGFIYPRKGKGELKVRPDIIKLGAYSVDFHIFFLNVPNDDLEFKENMLKALEEFETEMSSL